MTTIGAAYWSAGFAAGAAILWLWSAMIVVPNPGAILSGARIGGPTDRAIKRQSYLSASAAACAAVAAALQGLSTYLSTLPPP